MRDGAMSLPLATELTYSYNISNIILRVLSTRYLCDRMYFGPGLKVDKPREFYHGSLWRESLMFGDENVEIRKGALLFIICGLSFFFYPWVLITLCTNQA